MTTGYTRQSAGQIVDGNTATAAMFNNEFNKIQEAFNVTEGHNHDGTVGGGAKITPNGLAGVAANGAVFRISDSSFVARPLQGSANQIKVQQGDGVTGSPVISLEDSLTLTGKTLTGGTYTGGTIQSGMTINKSPVITFNGDFAGGGTITNLGDSSMAGGLRGITGNDTGIVARTGNGAFTVRTITPPSAGIAIDNGNGMSGNPTLRLVNDLAAVEGLTGAGLAVRTGDGAWTTRTIVGTQNQINVDNPGGSSGNPTLSFPAITQFPGSITVANGADFTGNVGVQGSVAIRDHLGTKGFVTTADFRQLIVTNGGVGIAQNNPTSSLHIGSASYTTDASIQFHSGNGSQNRNWRIGVRYGGTNATGAAAYGFFIQDTQAAQDRVWINYQTGVTTLNGGAFLTRSGTGSNLLVLNNPSNNSDDGCQVQYNGGIANVFTRVIQTPSAGAAVGAFQFLNSTYSQVTTEFRQNGTAFNSSGTWGALSDIRRKEHVEDARNYLEDLNKIRVVKYALKVDKLDRADKLGVIAQEVAEIFPGLVDEGVGVDGPELTVKTSVFTFMLLKAVQELTARVNHLESQSALG